MEQRAAVNRWEQETPLAMKRDCSATRPGAAQALPLLAAPVFMATQYRALPAPRAVLCRYAVTRPAADSTPMSRNRRTGEQKEYEFSEIRSNLLTCRTEKEKNHRSDSLPTAFARVGEGHRAPFALTCALQLAAGGSQGGWRLKAGTVTHPYTRAASPHKAPIQLGQTSLPAKRGLPSAPARGSKRPALRRPGGRRCPPGGARHLRAVPVCRM